MNTFYISNIIVENLYKEQRDHDPIFYNVGDTYEMSGYLELQKLGSYTKEYFKMDCGVYTSNGTVVVVRLISTDRVWDNAIKELPTMEEIFEGQTFDLINMEFFINLIFEEISGYTLVKKLKFYTV